MRAVIAFAATALLSATVTPDVRAALLRGDAEAVVHFGGWLSPDYADGTPPFGLDASSVAGVSASIRFWIQTDLLPADGFAEPDRGYYFSTLAEPEWLAMELEINGVVRAIGPGERFVDTWEGTGIGGDYLTVGGDRLAALPGDIRLYPESLVLDIVVEDFGQGGEIPNALHLTQFTPLRNGNVYYLSELVLDPATGGYSNKNEFYLDFDLLSVSLAPVPESGALALLALAALPLLGRRLRRG